MTWSEPASWWQRTRELYAAVPAPLREQLEEHADVVVLFDPAKVGQILDAAGA